MAYFEQDFPFCSRPGCELHVRWGDSGTRGIGHWAEMPDGRIIGRGLYDGVFMCDVCGRAALTAAAMASRMAATSARPLSAAAGSPMTDAMVSPLSAAAGSPLTDAMVSPLTAAAGSPLTDAAVALPLSAATASPLTAASVPHHEEAAA